MLQWDHELESWVATHRVGALDPIFKGLTHLGDYGWVWLAIALALALTRHRVQVLVWVAVTDAVAQVSTELIKLAVYRDRPAVNTLVAEPHSHSFPSGHASSSVACALVLGSFAPRLRVPLLVLAVLVAISRVYVGVHYPLDVIAGLLWGAVLGAAIIAVRHLRAVGAPR